VLKILVADDHRVLREGLKKIIENSSDMTVVAEASDGQEVLEKLRKISVDMVLLDISMPGPSGLDILKQIITKYPKKAVLMLSQHPEDQFAIRAFRAGAAGYLTKDRASSELIAAIRKVSSGGKWVSETAAEQLASSWQDDPSKPLHDTLSDREFEILCLLGSGQTATEIAKELSLSVKTISTYRTRVLEKMRLSKTADLIVYVQQHQLAISTRRTNTDT
jgi:DNA-binding NarL/FixJ family response regulator